MIYPLFFCPSIEGGGVEKNLYLLSNYSAKKFRKIYILTAHKNVKKKFDKRVILITPKSNKWSKSSRFVKSFVCFFLFLRLNKKFVLVSFQSNIMAIILAKIFSHKVIIRSNTSPSKYISNFLKKILFKIFFKFADQIVVNSNEFKKIFYQFFNIHANVIYNILEKKKLNVKKKIHSKKLNILNIGRLTDQKNQILLVKSLMKLDKKIPWSLKIIGRGYNYKILKDLILKNNLNKKIKLLGYKKNPYVYLKKANLFILSSNYEGLPNVLIEAQSCGIPIISSDCETGPKEILLNGKLGYLFSSGNIDSLKNKIEYVFNNRQQSIRKSNLAKKYLFRFDQKKNSEKYVSLINNLIDKFND